ncbi:predicted protein [Streptomyces viridochromogenes DSM 40736]|uniref:Predicted protein n=1 Tax=Streptomyces viridochromogenes (strain DSM 40736 / JCM 4977 / BCRC 1201 / Tue 494) TaxID=591159 RepID=D9X0B2_STRVT|nr:hypothetical protein [Streptomyces viridochromogenes]EFL35496.1 predicted protein [Streptomyces viridochromogenes DSM 40736]
MGSEYAVSPHQRRRALRHVQAHPGLTAHELTELLAAYDRSLFSGVLRSLRECCQVKVDDAGRIWPA